MKQSYHRLAAIVTLVLASGTLAGACHPRQPMTPPSAAAAPQFDVAAAQRFADLALACVDKEYPNKLSHVLTTKADVAEPHQLTPAFFGCFDWHSSVHGHWLLVRLARLFPAAPFAAQARAKLQQSLTADNLTKEVAYLNGEGRASFERPYGLAWLLTLSMELSEWQDPQAQQLSSNLSPLTQAVVARLTDYLPKLSHPIRIGEHSQTAFALGLMIDAARQMQNAPFLALVEGRARTFFGGDVSCPLSYEPSGEDFLSPCLAEADVMRRLLTPDEFAAWLDKFLPAIPRQPPLAWLQPAVAVDPSDPKLAHLDGLNLSRAWMLEGIAAGLPSADPRQKAIAAAAAAHREAGLKAVTGAHYEGGHWLGSFAVYLASQRGIFAPRSL